MNRYASIPPRSAKETVTTTGSSTGFGKAINSSTGSKKMPIILLIRNTTKMYVSATFLIPNIHPAILRTMYLPVYTNAITIMAYSKVVQKCCPKASL
jgi:hypothetical protein